MYRGSRTPLGLAIPALASETASGSTERDDSDGNALGVRELAEGIRRYSEPDSAASNTTRDNRQSADA